MNGKTQDTRAATTFWNMRKIRQWHNYVGVFFAPAILFFALSGALQTFSLHESHDGSSYKPPQWIVTIASIHKDQRLPRARPHPEGPGTGAHEHADASPKSHEPPHGALPQSPSPLPLKIFVLCLAIGLAGSALLGITIALKNNATRKTSLVLLAAGCLVPIFLLFL